MRKLILTMGIAILAVFVMVEDVRAQDTFFCQYCDMFEGVCKSDGLGFIKDICRNYGGPEDPWCWAHGGLMDCGDPDFAANPTTISGSGTAMVLTASLTESLSGYDVTTDHLVRNCRTMVIGRVYTEARRTEIRRLTETINL